MHWRLRLAMGSLVCAAICATAQGAPVEPEIRTDDVERFFRIFDATDGRPSAEVLQRDYLDAGSEGLQQLAKLRNVTGERIAARIVAEPDLYRNARECTSVLPRVRERVKGALDRLVEAYPGARLPPVTIAVGRGKPVGVATPSTGIQIGLEAMCATRFLNPDVEDRFVFVIAHEYMHVQQSQALVDRTEPTVLESSLLEGAAEFVGELIAGQTAYASLRAATAGRERDIEIAFVADMDKTDLSGWLYNSAPDKPGDLGYWVGYRIVKSYYQNASDKQVALREILTMEDAKALVAKSGWSPGIELRQQ